MSGDDLENGVLETIRSAMALRRVLEDFVAKYEKPGTKLFELNDEYFAACAVLGRSPKEIA